MKVFKDGNYLLRTDRLKYNLKPINGVVIDGGVDDDNSLFITLVVGILLFFVIK